MPEVVANTRTAWSGDEVTARTREFFATEDWRQTSQNGRMVVFQGRPRLPWYLQALIAAGLLAYVVPGIVLYLVCIRHARRFASIVVTTTSVRGGTDVVVHHPPLAEGLARRFVSQLPPLQTRTRPRQTTEPLPGLQLRLTGSGRA
jgi:hypothetical protein